MSITIQELNEFTQFADERIRSGTVDSFLALANEWDSRHRAGAISIDNESLSILAAAFPNIEDKQQLRAAMSRKDGVTTHEMLQMAMLAAEAQGR